MIRCFYHKAETILVIFLPVLIHLVQYYDNLRLVPKFQAPVHEILNIKEMVGYFSGIQNVLCRTVVFHGWLPGVPQAHLLIQGYSKWLSGFQPPPPPRPPDATPRSFFLWGYVKDQVYVPPLPAGIPELRVRIRTAIETITVDMLLTVSNQLNYHVDVCRITKGAHI